MDPRSIAKRVIHPSFANKTVALRVVHAIINATPRFRKKAINGAVIRGIACHADRDVRITAAAIFLRYLNSRARVRLYRSP